ILAFDPNLSGHPRTRDDVIHPVHRAQERALAAARRTDERRDQLGWQLHGDVEQRLVRSVEEGHVLDIDGRRMRLDWGPGRARLHAAWAVRGRGWFRRGRGREVRIAWGHGG